MFKWFKKIFKRGDSNVKAILKKLLNGEALSEEEKAEAMKYVGEETTENQESEPIDKKTDETVETETNEVTESTEENLAMQD